MKYAMLFIFVDLAAYVFVYTVFALMAKGFSLPSALYDGAQMSLGRVIYLQAIIEVVGIWILLRFFKNHSFILLQVVCISALLGSWFFIFREIGHFFNYYKVNFHEAMLGPGAALLISSSLAWLILRFVLPQETSAGTN